MIRHTTTSQPKVTGHCRPPTIASSTIHGCLLRFGILIDWISTTHGTGNHNKIGKSAITVVLIQIKGLLPKDTKTSYPYVCLVMDLGVVPMQKTKDQDQPKKPMKGRDDSQCRHQLRRKMVVETSPLLLLGTPGRLSSFRSAASPQ